MLFYSLSCASLPFGARPEQTLFAWVTLLNGRLWRGGRAWFASFPGGLTTNLEGLLRHSMEVAENSASRCEPQPTMSDSLGRQTAQLRAALRSHALRRLRQALPASSRSRSRVPDRKR